MVPYNISVCFTQTELFAGKHCEQQLKSLSDSALKQQFPIILLSLWISFIRDYPKIAK